MRLVDMLKHTDQNVSLGSTAPIAVLQALCCTLCVDVLVYVCWDWKFKCVCCVSVSSEVDPYTHLCRVNSGVKHPEDIDCNWKLEDYEVAGRLGGKNEWDLTLHAFNIFQPCLRNNSLICWNWSVNNLIFFKLCKNYLYRFSTFKLQPLG